MWRVGRSLARQWNSSDLDVGDALWFKGVSFFGGNFMPINAAVMFEDFEDRVSRGEIFVHHICAVNVERRFRFSEHEQAGGVVYLCI